MIKQFATLAIIFVSVIGTNIQSQALSLPFSQPSQSRVCRLEKIRKSVIDRTYRNIQRDYTKRLEATYIKESSRKVDYSQMRESLRGKYNIFVNLKNDYNNYVANCTQNSINSDVFKASRENITTSYREYLNYYKNNINTFSPLPVLCGGTPSTVGCGSQPPSPLPASPDYKFISADFNTKTNTLNYSFDIYHANGCSRLSSIEVKPVESGGKLDKLSFVITKDTSGEVCTQIFRTERVNKSINIDLNKYAKQGFVSHKNIEDFMRDNRSFSFNVNLISQTKTSQN
jgi:hypothetical protein